MTSPASSTRAAPAAIELRDVCKFYADHVAVDRVTLTIRQGEFFSLLGPSGCGKTTLLRMIGGFDGPSTGDILIDGTSVIRLPPSERPTNMVFQNLALFPHLDVWENIAFGLRCRGERPALIKEKVEQFLAIVRLESLARRGVHQLSGGQQQRVAIARALVNEPRVLLLDEPLSALDAHLRHEMQAELRRIQRMLHSTFVFVTHDQAEAMAISDRVAVMQSGRVLQVGEPEDLYRRPATRFIAEFIGQSNTWAGTVIRSDALETELDCNGERVFGRTGDGQPLAPGSAACAVIKYESVQLHDDGDRDAEVEVMDQTFLGAYTRMACTRRGAPFFVDVPSQTASRIRVGDRRAARWQPQDVIVLTR